MRWTVLTSLAIAFAFSGCATVDPAAPPGAPPLAEPEAPVSRIAVTAKVSWPAVRSKLDEAIPKCHGRFPECLGTEASHHFIVQREGAWEVIGSIGGKDVGWKGSVWRWNPVNLSLAGQTLTASVDVLYHAVVGFTQFGGVASCGYGEAARQMTPTISAKVMLAPEWHANVDFSASAVTANACKLTALNIDVTGQLVRGVERALKKHGDKLSAGLRERTNVREAVAAVWTRISEPMEIGPNLWLDVRPRAAYAGPLNLVDGDQYLALTAALEAQPRIVAGGKPARTPSPLPALKQGSNDPNFSVFLRGGIAFEDASRLLHEAVADRTFTLGASWPKDLLKFRVTKVAVSGNGGELVVAVTIDGSAKGTLFLVGTPRFVSEGPGGGGFIVVDDLDYTLETRNVLVKAGDIIFHTNLLERLRQVAKWDVSTSIQGANEQLRKAVNRPLSPQARLEGKITGFGPRVVWVGPGTIDALVQAEGQVAVVLSP